MKKGLLFLMMFVCGCSTNTDEPNKEQGEAPTGAHFSKSFIQTYVIPDAMDAYIHLDQYIAIRYDGQIFGSVRDSEKEGYEALCEKYNDLSYNRKIVPNSKIALGRDYTAIHVVCDKAIDDAHPAGASLNNIIKLCAVSYSDFIASGYDAAFRTPEKPIEFAALSLDNGIGAMPIFKLLSELDKDDFRLIDPEMYLYLPKKPNAGQYEFTITMNSAEGNLTCKVKALF